MAFKRATFLILGAVWLFALHANHEAIAEQSASNKAQPRTGALPGTIGQLPRAKEYKPDCQKPQSHIESDLCAQWGAVDAGRRANALAAEANRTARDANAINAEAILWTQRGFIAIFLTLIVTAWAAWAAARAAAIADESLSLFREAEGGILAPRINITSGGAAHSVVLYNRGRSPVTVIHADFSVLAEKPRGPIEPVVHRFPRDILIAPDNVYKFGQFKFNTDERYVYFVGGSIYKTFFWETRLCRIAVRVDRADGSMQVIHGADFSKWESMIDAIRPLRWWQFWRRRT